jgi:hypothetical protein
MAMATKDIRTSVQDTVCDVCGRTLLRGERAEVYLNGGARRSVCELCKDRALHEGWIREGTVPAYEESDAGSDRRRSLLGRLRGRRDAPGTTATPSLLDELDNRSWSEATPSRTEQPAPVPAPTPRERLRERAERLRDREPAQREIIREPRHVRAVPTSIEQKIVAAAEMFNGSEHPRTVAGVARSLGAPDVSVAPADPRSSLVRIVVSWELCWYRYEVELADVQPSVRVAGQGYELDELPAEERRANAAADEHGSLHVAG